MNSIAFSPDGQTLAAGSPSKTMVWDLSSGKSTGTSLGVTKEE